MYQNYVRTPIKIDQLIQLSQKILDDHHLYLKEDIDEFDENTLVYLDDPIDIDDQTDQEIYPAFASANNLEWYFSGQVVYDIIFNTKQQLPNPTLENFITNFNYYDQNDCFYTFNN